MRDRTLSRHRQPWCCSPRRSPCAPRRKGTTMLGRSLLGAGVRRRAARLATATLVVAALGTGGGCLTRPIAPLTPDSTSTVVTPLRTSAVNKIDLLFVVDNTGVDVRQAEDPQASRSRTCSSSLVNPPASTPRAAAVANQPSGPLGTCPEGSTREFPPVLDIHVGVITSSLGTYGARAARRLRRRDGDQQRPRLAHRPLRLHEPHGIPGPDVPERRLPRLGPGRASSSPPGESRPRQPEGEPAGHRDRRRRERLRLRGAERGLVPVPRRPDALRQSIRARQPGRDGSAGHGAPRRSARRSSAPTRSWRSST